MILRDDLNGYVYYSAGDGVAILHPKAAQCGRFIEREPERVLGVIVAKRKKVAVSSSLVLWCEVCVRVCIIMCVCRGRGGNNTKQQEQGQ